MEAPQITINRTCPLPCQEVFEKINDSMKRAADAVNVSEDPDNDIQKAVRFRAEMHAKGNRDPEAEARIDGAVAADQAAHASAVGELVRMEKPVQAINNMAACAFGGCKAQKGAPLVEAARQT